MNFEIEKISNEEIETYKESGYAAIFVFANAVHYETSKDSRKYELPKKNPKSEFFYVLSKSGSLSFTDNIRGWSKDVNYRSVTCVCDYNDELDLDKDSYRFLLDFPATLYDRFKTTYYDVATEVIVLKEENIQNDMTTQ